MDEDFITGYLVPFRVIRASRAQIETVEIIEIRLRQAGGIGWRIMNTGGHLPWTAGPGVKVTLRGGAVRVLRCRRPEDLAHAIRG